MVFRISWTPVRSTARRKSQKIDVQEWWDSCAQNKTSEIPRNALSGILGLLCAEQNVENIKQALLRILGHLCAEQNVGNIKNCTFRNSGTPVRKTERRKHQQDACSGILGLFCAEKNVVNLNKCTFMNSGTPVCRTKRQKYQTMHYQEFWDSCAQNNTSQI